MNWNRSKRQALKELLVTIKSRSDNVAGWRLGNMDWPNVLPDWRKCSLEELLQVHVEVCQGRDQAFERTVPALRELLVAVERLAKVAPVGDPLRAAAIVNGPARSLQDAIRMCRVEELTQTGSANWSNNAAVGCEDALQIIETKCCAPIERLATMGKWTECDEAIIASEVAETLTSVADFARSVCAEYAGVNAEGSVFPVNIPEGLALSKLADCMSARVDAFTKVIEAGGHYSRSFKEGLAQLKGVELPPLNQPLSSAEVALEARKLVDLETAINQGVSTGLFGC